jgi:hypothetical protein
MRRWWRRFKLKASKPWRWLRFRWRLYREPCAIAKTKMVIGWKLLGPVEDTSLALSEWIEDNREFLDEMAKEIEDEENND